MFSTRKLGIIVGNLLRIIPFTLLSTAIPTDMMRFLFVTHAFSPMLCVTRPTGSNTKHERQCAPHDGSLATVCGNSRGGGIVHIWRFLKQKMPLILLSDTCYLTLPHFLCK